MHSRFARQLGGTWNWHRLSLCQEPNQPLKILGCGRQVVRSSLAQCGGSCTIPTGESSDAIYNGSVAPEISFYMTLQGGTFTGSTLKEVSQIPGSNGCYWSGSPMPQHPVVQGSSWTVGVVNGKTAPTNQYGYDSIGWNTTDLNLIATTGAKNGVKSGCVTDIYQTMEIWCPTSSSYLVYKNNLLKITATWPPQEEQVCRDDPGQGECDSD
jgi:hypothetical protein